MPADWLWSIFHHPTTRRPKIGSIGAWTAHAVYVPILPITLLGLTVDVPNRLIRLDPPRPSPVGAITVTGLPLADGQLEINIDRTGRVLDVSAPADFAVHLSHV